jgi:hypothetical protein
MTEEEANKKFWQAVNSYIKDVQKELVAHTKAWKIDLTKTELYEVVGGLLARQVTISTELAKAPQIWNGHIAPVILRTMVDTYITLAWILEKPLERSRQFILFGLGQEKLTLEHHKAEISSRGKKLEDHPYVKQMEDMLNSQRYTFLTEVNVGSWSGHDVRKMADEADCLDLYHFAYTPFSAATHSMWHHIVRYNLRYCNNPLHKYHRIPVAPEVPHDEDFLYRAAKYAAKTFDLFRRKTDVKPNVPSAFDRFNNTLREISQVTKDTDIDNQLNGNSPNTPHHDPAFEED